MVFLMTMLLENAKMKAVKDETHILIVINAIVCKYFLF